MASLQQILAAKAQQNLQTAKAAAPVNTAAGNIQTGMASSSYGRLRSEVSFQNKELNKERARAALAVYEDIKLRLIPRGKGQAFKSENGYFYVETEFDQMLISGYANKSIPVIKQVDPADFAEEEKE